MMFFYVMIELFLLLIGNAPDITFSLIFAENSSLSTATTTTASNTSGKYSG